MPAASKTTSCLPERLFIFFIQWNSFKLSLLIAVFTFPVIVKLKLEKTAVLNFIVAASCAFSLALRESADPCISHSLQFYEHVRLAFCT